MLDQKKGRTMCGMDMAGFPRCVDRIKAGDCPEEDAKKATGRRCSDVMPKIEKRTKEGQGI